MVEGPPYAEGRLRRGRLQYRRKGAAYGASRGACLEGHSGLYQGPRGNDYTAGAERQSAPRPGGTDVEPSGREKGGGPPRSMTTNAFGGDTVTEGNSEESLCLEEVAAEEFTELEEVSTEE